MKMMTLLAAASIAFLALAATAQDAQTETETQEKETDTVHVLMKTSMGDIALELNREKAPITVDNFMQYARDGHYEGTIFHRVISNFMIQGGGFTERMQQKPTRDGIKNEWDNGLNHDRGTIAMARVGHQHDSATAQFFINVTDNHFLNEADRPGADGAGYAVFGKVIDGMDVVDRIRDVRTGRDPTTNMPNVPVEAVVIREVRPMTDEEVARVKEKNSEER